MVLFLVLLQAKQTEYVIIAETVLDCTQLQINQRPKKWQSSKNTQNACEPCETELIIKSKKLHFPSLYFPIKSTETEAWEYVSLSNSIELNWGIKCDSIVVHE